MKNCNDFTMIFVDHLSNKSIAAQKDIIFSNLMN